MPTYPTFPRSAFVEWCEAHTGVFAAAPAQIGLTPAQAAAFAADTAAAADAIVRQEAARQGALAATRTAEAALATLRASAAGCVRSIRTFAENDGTAGGGGVYQEAQIPPPSAPSPVPPPGQPTRLTARLDATTGDLTLRWRCANPPGSSGTSYVVRRRVPGPGGGASAFTFVGITGVKAFTDTGLTAGADRVEYTVQPHRADRAGPVSAILIVNFGKPGQAMARDAASAEESPRLAA